MAYVSCLGNKGERNVGHIRYHVDSLLQGAVCLLCRHFICHASCVINDAELLSDARCSRNHRGIDDLHDIATHPELTDVSTDPFLRVLIVPRVPFGSFFFLSFSLGVLPFPASPSFVTVLGNIVGESPTTDLVFLHCYVFFFFGCTSGPSATQVLELGVLGCEFGVQATLLCCVPTSASSEPAPFLVFSTGFL